MEQTAPYSRLREVKAFELGEADRTPTRTTWFERLMSLSWRPAAAVAFCGLLGLILPAAYGLLSGIPEPRIQDEFCYLLAAETFASGRLTNPAPALPEFFEAPHVLVTPTYSSKYPPAQGLILALGSIVGGHPIWGVWLSCGLFAAALCWMLLAWTTRPWALATTLVAIASIGLTTYWAQSYFGGMMAATGGALLFGGVRRISRAPSVLASLLLGAGVVILANSRPFEGFLACIPTAIVLVRWFVHDSRYSRRIKIQRALVPFTVVMLAGAGWMLTYNRAVTGSWLTLPYSLHQDQYFHQDVYLFSPLRAPERIPAEPVALFYAGNETQPYRGFRLFEKLAENFILILPSAIESAFGVMRIDSGLGVLTPTGGDREGHRRGVLVWMIALVIISVWNRWTRYAVATTVLVVLGGAAIIWWHKHYSAPIVPLVLALLATTMRKATRASSLERRYRRLAPAGVVMLALVLVVVPSWYPAVAQHLRSSARVPAAEARNPTPRDVRRATISEIERHPGNHILFVKYLDEGSAVRSHWVYNSADLPSSRVIFAHDLGAVRNGQLIASFPDRSLWTVSVSRSGAELKPYPHPGAR